MKIQQKQKDEIQILELQGELDFQTSPELRVRLTKLMESPFKKVLINLKKVSYIDSSGLATFVEALQKMKRANGQLVLSELAPAVRGVFEIAKLDRVFLLAGTEEDGFKLLLNANAS